MRRVLVLLTAAVVILLGVVRTNYSGVSDVAHQSIRLQLECTGASIYEFHATFGRWPTQNVDLARTALPAVLPYWRYLLDEELVVIVWDPDLRPRAADNADRILAYYNKGLISEMGRSWVCWGDLRTEYIATDDLRAYLANRKK